MASSDSGIVLADLSKGKLLGRGASGKVYLVTHEVEGMRYALKELVAIADQSARHQALNELRIAKRHAEATEHLVKLVDGYFDDGKILMLMEYCDGGSLEDAFKAVATIKGTPPLPLGPIIVQMLQGLLYMHNEMKQVHRDLKPANVLLSSEGMGGKGVVKLSDFGISKQLASTQAVAVTQVGTTAYMSPERLKGDQCVSLSPACLILPTPVLFSLRALVPDHAASPHALFPCPCVAPACTTVHRLIHFGRVVRRIDGA